MRMMRPLLLMEIQMEMATICGRSANSSSWLSCERTCFVRFRLFSFTSMWRWACLRKKSPSSSFKDLQARSSLRRSLTSWSGWWLSLLAGAYTSRSTIWPPSLTCLKRSWPSWERRRSGGTIGSLGRPPSTSTARLARQPASKFPQPGNTLLTKRWHPQWKRFKQRNHLKVSERWCWLVAVSLTCAKTISLNSLRHSKAFNATPHPSQVKWLRHNWTPIPSPRMQSLLRLRLRRERTIIKFWQVGWQIIEINGYLLFKIKTCPLNNYHQSR